MGILDLISKEHNTGTLSTMGAGDAFAEVATREIGAMSAGTHSFSTGNPVWNFFKKAAGRGGAKPELPSGATHDQWIQWLEKNFGLNSSKTVIGTVEHAQNETRLEGALKRMELGKLDKDAIRELEKGAYDAQVKHLKSLRATLEQAESMAAGAADGIFPKIEAEILAINDSFAELASQKFSATKAAGVKDLDEMRALMEAKLAGSGAMLDVAKSGPNKGSLVANIVNHETGKLEQLVLAAEGQSVKLSEVRDALRAQRQFMFEAPKNYVKNLTDEIGKMKEELVKSEKLVDDVGSKVLGKTKSAFGAAEQAVVKATAEVGAEANKIMNITEKAKSLGVIGEEAMAQKGFFGKMLANAKANLNIKEVIKDGSQIGIVERGTLSKGMTVAGAGAGAILVGYGLKDLGKAVGFVSPDTDEQGREIPADSGTLVKSVAELGAGAALAYFTLLKGGKAAGILSK